MFLVIFTVKIVLLMLKENLMKHIVKNNSAEILFNVDCRNKTLTSMFMQRLC